MPTLSDHGGAGELLNDFTACCGSTWRARQRGELLGGVLYLNGWHSSNVRRLRPTQTERKSRLHQEPVGNEICYALQVQYANATTHARESSIV
jgi:hypothetical protein